MPGVKRKVSTTSFSGTLRSSLGITPSGGKRAKTVTRKEARKADRMKKRKLAPAARPAVASKAHLAGEPKHVKKDKDLTDSTKSKSKTSRSSIKPTNFISMAEDPEDMEIARLEKLLGVSSKGKNREKSAGKLNKELEMYEGIGGKFGDFLMRLDDFAQYKESEVPGGKHGMGGLSSDSEEDSDAEEGPRMLNDSDQEASDLDLPLSDGEEDSDEDSDGSEEEGEEEGEGWFDDADEYAAPQQRQDTRPEQEDSEGEDSEEEDSEEEEEDHAPGSTYRPVQGEDIYGRVVSAGSVGAAAAKYVPPALRKKLEQEAAAAAGGQAGGQAGSRKGKEAASFVIDDSSEAARLLRRQVNGQLNRLSEQSRDSIAKGLQELFAKNSFTLCCHTLKECLLGVCSSATQLMRTLIPHYAALIAALHHSVDFQIGSYILESLVVQLHQLLQENSRAALKGDQQTRAGADDHSLISDKTAANLLLIVAHLYNLRVVHHSLVMDLFLLLVDEHSPLTALRVELILCIVDQCGQSLRSDDPGGLKQGILQVMKLTQSSSGGEEDGSSSSAVRDLDKGRVKCMLEALADLKNNKSASRRQQSAQAETVQQTRRWIGRVKAGAAGGAASGDACLHISLQDFLQAETRGRWWRAGASWGGRTVQASAVVPRDHSAQQKSAPSTASNATPDEEKQLLRVAKKLGMNTDIRKQIFLVVMSSRDVTDAFERLARLDLKGKQDREVARVLCECCGSEKNYNEFYAELAALFCAQNRQYKITLQYAFWDLFKTLGEHAAGDKARKQADRRAINMARMLAHLTANFHMSLSALKVVDVSALSSGMLLFLATFFMSLFSAKISNETFMSVLDRVATTSDCLVVREFVLIFLQHHFKKIPSGLPAADTKLMEKRRRDTIRTMDAMSVLDVAQGVAERGGEVLPPGKGRGGKQHQFDDF